MNILTVAIVILFTSSCTSEAPVSFRNESAASTQEKSFPVKVQISGFSLATDEDIEFMGVEGSFIGCEQSDWSIQGLEGDVLASPSCEALTFLRVLANGPTGEDFQIPFGENASTDITSLGQFKFSQNPDSGQLILVRIPEEESTPNIDSEESQAASDRLLGDVDGDGDFDANDAQLIHMIKMAVSLDNVNSIKGSSPLSAVEIQANVDNLARNNKGDVDKDGDFDASDALLILNVMLSAPTTQIETLKGSSTETAEQIVTNVLNLASNTFRTLGDVDNNGAFDANDGALIHYVKLSGVDPTIIRSYLGSSPISVQSVIANVQSLSYLNQGDVTGDSVFDSTDSNLIKIALLSATDSALDAAKGSSSLPGADIRLNVFRLGLHYNAVIAGDIDGNNGFDANDAQLMHLIKLSGDDTSIDNTKGASSLSAQDIRKNLDILESKYFSDVDGDQDFDANDSDLILSVLLSSTDESINVKKGNSPLSAAQIRQRVFNLGLRRY